MTVLYDQQIQSQLLAQRELTLDEPVDKAVSCEMAAKNFKTLQALSMKQDNMIPTVVNKVETNK